jgi:solute carrier family 35 protein F5
MFWMISYRRRSETLEGAIELGNEDGQSLTQKSSMDCSDFSTESNNIVVRILRYGRKPLPSDYSHEDVLYMAFLLTPLWFIGNLFYNYSLSLTSISSSTVIRLVIVPNTVENLRYFYFVLNVSSNTSGVFTLFFSWIFGIEEITAGKVLGLSLCFGGVILVAIQDESSADDGTSEEGVMGDLVAVIGAMCYGLYTTILKMKVFTHC